MIDSLTPEQEKQLISFREDCLKIGLQTGPANIEGCVEPLNYIYKTYLKKDPPYIWHCQSPLQAQLIINLLKHFAKEGLGNNLWNNLWNNLRNNLWNNLRNNLKTEYEPTELWGSLDIFWICFYKFPEMFLGIKYTKEESEGLDQMYKLSQNSFFVYTFDNVVFVCDRPTKIYKKDVLLHCENGPAVEFSDGYCLWYLDGVEVPEKLVTTKETNLDPKEWIQHENVSVRAQFVKKYGVERLKSYGMMIHKADVFIGGKNHHYEVINMERLLGVFSPYLQMENASVKGVFHMEGVPVDCDTVEKAYNSRKPKKMLEIPITMDGEDWYQQGDVCVWPRNAKALRMYPKVLT